MPYIKKEDRHKVDEKILEIARVINEVGEYNYVITRLLHAYIEKNGLRYKYLNDVVGILGCVSNEFYRMVVSGYEDCKIKTNGCVSEIDKNK